MPDDKNQTEYTPTEAPKRQKRTRVLGLAAFILLNGVVLFFTARADFAKSAPAMDSGLFTLRALPYLAGALICLAVVLGTESAKYMLMMRRLGEKISLRNAFETAALGKYYDCITPSGAGGQPFQIWYLLSKGYSGGAASSMPLAGFTTMQYAFVLLALLTFVFYNNATDAVGIKIAAYVGTLAYALVPTMIVISAVSPAAAAKIVNFFVRLGGRLRLVKSPEETAARVENALQSYSASLKLMMRTRFLLLELTALSLLFHVALCSLPYFVIHMFGEHLDFFRSLCMCVFVYASVTIVPTPGNAGAAEGSFYLLFDQLDTSGLFWAMLVWRFFCYYAFILVGLGVYAVSAVERFLRRHRT